MARGFFILTVKKKTSFLGRCFFQSRLSWRNEVIRGTYQLDEEKNLRVLSSLCLVDVVEEEGEEKEEGEEEEKKEEEEDQVLIL